MRRFAWILLAASVAIALVVHGWRMTHAPTSATASSAGDAASLDPGKFLITTSTETEERVRRAFPRGLASEDATGAIGSAPPPPGETAPDPETEWVAILTPPPDKPLTAERLRGASPGGDAAVFERRLEGRPVGLDRWVVVADVAADTPFDGVALVLPLLVHSEELAGVHAISPGEIDLGVRWARELAALLSAPPPAIPLSREKALAKASAASSLRQAYADQEGLEVSISITAADGRKFGGKAVWDVMYSAGFHWGDGDYFHWVPSAETDVGQGISVRTSTGSGYFLPESIATDGGDVDDLDMSFNVARTWQPTQVFDVMDRAATYAARRLEGTVLGADGEAFDRQAARARVEAIEHEMLAHGVTPGSALALDLF